MAYNIFACEPNYLMRYLSDIETLPDEKLALGMQDLLKKPPSIYRVNGDIAEISINGVLLNDELPFIARMFGYRSTSYKDIISSINEAMADASVKTIELYMDTPGGEVIGVDEVRSAIESARGKKKVTAINTGMIASAGYWIASGADEIVSTSAVNETGSIGVVITQYSYSDEHVKKIKILSRNAENKQPDASTNKGFAILQEKANAIERVFLERVADGRGVSVKNVIDKFGKGDLYIAYDPDADKSDALSVGMIDSITKKEEKMGTEATPVAQVLTLADALNHPNIKSEFDASVKQAYDEGVANASKVAKELQERYQIVANYLKSDSYGQSVKNMAYEVLEGKVSAEMFRGAVTMYDAMAAKDTIDAGVADTADTASTYSPPEFKRDLNIVTDADEDAIVASMGGK